MSTRTLLHHAAQVIAGAAAVLVTCLAPAFCGSAAHVPTRFVTLSVAGDCTFGAVNGDGGPGRFPTVMRQSGRADYPFARVKRYLQQDDLSLVNGEGTFTNAATPAHKQWHFRGDARYASLFKAGSVEAVSLANNHAPDYLAAGFRDTRAAFAAAHVPVFYENHPFVTAVRGVRVVVIGDCTAAGGRIRPAALSIIPCCITSATARNAAGVLLNNYQPRPVFGRDAARLRALIVARSAVLPNGVRRIAF